MSWERLTAIRVRGLPVLPVAFIIACFTAGGLLFASAASTPKQPKTVPHYVTKSIEDVQVGDWVLAKDLDHAGKATPHQVVALPRNWTEHVVHVQVEGGGEVNATRNHPFYVEGRGWVEASELKAGDRLRDEQDRTIRIERLWTEDRTTDTFNLTVEGVHTYYVLAGGTPVLVHNSDPPSWFHQQVWDQDLEEGATAHDLDFWGGEGRIYRVPGEGTASGLPYIGRSGEFDVRQKFSGDGRDRSIAETIGRYPKDDEALGKAAEQRAINEEGGLSKTDNRRNEIRGGGPCK